MKRVGYGTPVEDALFQLPSNGLKEARELTQWNAAKMKKQLLGRPAPALAVHDMEGKTVNLESFRGKTVLLDFWTTWCSPCRADAPALDKLQKVRRE